MRPLFRFGGVLVALVTSAAMWGAMPAGADDTQVVHAGQSIQAAVDRAQAGDTIVVEHGTYAEDVEIHKNGIHLVGRPVGSALGSGLRRENEARVAIAAALLAGANDIRVKRERDLSQRPSASPETTL